MAASVFDSPLFAHLFPTGDIGKLFTDSAEVRAMMLVQGALAKAQGQLDIIPKISAAAIHRASLEIQIDPGALATATGQNGVSVPGLVAAFRKEMEAPEHAQYIHWGATSQDVIDTGLMLRLRQYLTHMETALDDTLASLATLSRTHATLPMAARTYGQYATPTSFGAVVANWGEPLLALRNDLPTLRAACLWVSLSGAAGTAAALGPKAREIRAALATALYLNDPHRTWHSDRTPILALASWLTRLATALGKFARDLILMSQSGINEISLGASGASSTMPQKQNPVLPSAIGALAQQVIGLNTTLQTAALHTQERDGVAWFTEWLTLPQLCLATASALQQAQTLSKTLAPNATAMRSALTNSHGLLYAEALSFELAKTLPRPEAQAAVKTLCKQVGETGNSLDVIAKSAYPNLDLSAVFDPVQQLGDAPSAANSFADTCHSKP